MTEISWGVFIMGCGRSPRCDSLLVGDDVLCLMETKALSILVQSEQVDSGRKAKRVAKDVDKALRQLKGAVRNLRAGTKAFETHLSIRGLARQPDRLIELPPADCVILGLVVISDLESDIDWDAVTKDYLDASDEKTLYQIVDLSQLRSLVGTARSAMQFITNVVVRWGKAHESKTFKIHVRVWRKDQHRDRARPL
jgi:hypothetical protein